MSELELETSLDKQYFQKPLPHLSKVLATWYFLTVSEDMLRNMFTDMGAQISTSRIIFYIDRFKYSMRYALDRISNENTDRTWTEVPRHVLPKLYYKAAELIYAGIDYALASQLCGALHNRTATAIKGSDAWHVSIDESHHDRAYTALELLGVAKPITEDFVTLLFRWIRTPSAIPKIVEKIAKSTLIQGKFISYTYQQDFAVELAQKMPQQPYLIPDKWKFPWGSRQEITLLQNSLSLRCLYHLLAIHFGSGIHKIDGGGQSNILLVISHDQLITDLELMSSVNQKQIRAFINHITLGCGTSTPDPALQPLIRIGSGKFAIPCIHILSSNLERNLLSLMARTHSKEFDSQSYLFEKDMIAALLLLPRPAGIELQANVCLHIDGSEEEIDLLFIDKLNRHLLVCELRWMLGPGDPREVQNRKKECLKKVIQVRRKVEKVSSPSGINAALALDHNVQSNIQGWTTSGVVLITGFGGTRSPDPKYPIIPTAVFEQAMAKASTLETLVSWGERMNWLPKEREHFNVMTMTITLDDSVPLILQGIDTPGSLHDYFVDALADLE